MVYELIAALDNLSELLEARKKSTGLKHRRHAKHLAPARKAMEQIMQSYFARQEKEVLAHAREELPHLMDSFGVKEAAVANRFSHTLFPTTLSPLTIPLLTKEIADYAEAVSEVIAGAGKVFATEFAAHSIDTSDIASQWLRKNSLTKLTGDIAEASLDRLRNAVADAWDAGGSANQIIDAIKETFETFSDSRATVIAQTEMNKAYSQSRLAIASELGYEEKSWDPEGDACEEICMPNVDQEWIDLDEDFESGDDAPPAHPSCDCSVNFRKGAESRDEEEERWKN